MLEWKSTRRAVLGAALAALAFSAFAAGDAWPRRPIRWVVAGPPGSGMDIFARLISVPLSSALKQPVVIDNRAGANSIIGNDAVAKAQPDGYTFLFTPSSAIAINPIIQAKMPYDTLKDLLPVAQVGIGGILLVANPSTGFKNFDDMVRYAQANPGKLSYGTWGNGSTGHLVMEGLKAHYKLFMTHIPYKGTASLVQDLLANNVSVAFTDIASPLPYARAGKLTILGATGSARGPALPDVPTLSEQGYKFDLDGWYGVFAPASTPQSIVHRMNEEIGRILATEEMKEKFAAQNFGLPPFKTAEQFAAMVRSDVAQWQSLAKSAQLKID